MVYEHRVNAEKKLGRKLLAGEIVHHIDEDKSNNAPENLLVFKTKADHSRFHKIPPGNREILLLADGAYICRRHSDRGKCMQCGTPFMKTHYRKGISRQIYCSKQCAKLAAAQSSVKPSKEELSELLKKESFVAIGKRFNVSDNAVRKWCKSYDLPAKKGDVDIWRLGF